MLVNLGLIERAVLFLSSPQRCWWARSSVRAPPPVFTCPFFLCLIPAPWSVGSSARAGSRSVGTLGLCAGLTCLPTGGGHPWDPGPTSGGPQHHRDAGHHGAGPPASRSAVCDGPVRAVRPWACGAAGTLPEPQATLCQQGRCGPVWGLLSNMQCEGEDFISFLPRCSLLSS